MTSNGALFAPGRWHSQGRRVIYCSSSLALATLELFVNLKIKAQLAHQVKSYITFPAQLVEALPEQELRSFLAAPEKFDSRAFGDTWLAQNRSCALRVPSRVIPQEDNYLLNPVHEDFHLIRSVTDAFSVDKRWLT